MKDSTKNQAKGKADRIAGKLKEVVGAATGKRRLEAEGKDQALAGRIREKLGQLEKVVGK